MYIVHQRDTISILSMIRLLHRVIPRQHTAAVLRSRPSLSNHFSTNIISSNFEHLDISFDAKNLPDMLMARFADDDVKDRTAFVDGMTGEVKTYGTLLSETNSFANGLVEMGIQKGDCVAIMAPTHLHYFTSFVGVALAGGFTTPINPAYTETEITHQLNFTNPKLIITHKMCQEVVMKAAVERQIPVISMGKSEIDKSCGNTISIDEIIAQNPSTRPLTDVRLDDTLTVPFSSGTSGQPK